MTKNKIRIIAALLATATFAVALVVVLHFCTPKITDLPLDHSIPGVDGAPVSTVCISDLGECNAFRYVNYVPNEFLKPGSELAGEIVDLTAPGQFANKGTFQFVVLNLDPGDPEFNTSAQQLSPYLKGDNNWHFTLYLPPCLSACNVYVRTLLDCQVGELTDYNFVEYTSSNYTGKTETHKETTEPLFLDLNFYTRREAISPMPEWRALTVTVHYETEKGRPAGYTSLPLIGTETAIRKQVSTDRSLLWAIAFFSVLMTVTFAFVCVLKKSVSFLPQTLMTSGIFGFAVTYVLLNGVTKTPYLLQVLGAVSFSLIALAAVFIQKVTIQKFPLWVPVALLAVMRGVFVSVSVYRPAAFVLILCTVLDCLIAGGLVISSLMIACKDHTHRLSALQLLTAVLLLTAVCIPLSQPMIFAPAVWLLVLMLAIITVTGILFFVNQERRNVFLTSNLQSEVNRQTNDLKEMIAERDKLLQYLSHDLRKPVLSAKEFLTQLQVSRAEDERQFALSVMKQKLNGIDNSLTDLQKYAKTNYMAESPAFYDIQELLSGIFEDLNPDCIANDTLLNCHSGHIRIFAKKNSLLMILNNLIFNALEHSGCNAIDISASKSKQMCRITVSDNGKGIEEGADIFRPYYSENDHAQNLGLGLYICRQYAHSMGGDLTYERINEQTVFTVTVPLA